MRSKQIVMYKCSIKQLTFNFEINIATYKNEINENIHIGHGFFIVVKRNKPIIAKQINKP